MRGELRELQLRQTELKVKLKMQVEKIDRLEGENKRLYMHTDLQGPYT